MLPPDVPQLFLPPTQDNVALQYDPVILALADLTFTNAKLDVSEQRRVILLTPMDDGPITIDWNSAERVELDPNALERSARDGATFGEVPTAATTPKSYASWNKSFQKWLVTNEQVELLSSPTLGLNSTNGESERDFRIRLQVAAREQRDSTIEALRRKYASKLTSMQERIRRAQQAVDREQAQATQAKVSSMISVGSAILGAVFGRGKVTATEIGKVGTAVRGVGRAAQERSDVGRASESVAALQAMYNDLEAQLQGEIDALGPPLAKFA